MSAVPFPYRAIDRYVIRRELGRGGMGVVYLADDPHLGRDVAIKIIRTDVVENSAEFEQLDLRFQVEARAAARLHHPGIVAIYDFGTEEKTKYIVMEYVDGTNLNRPRGSKPLPAQQAIAIIEQVANALDYAHRHRVIHRDIKPANILVSNDGIAKVTDFGIAKVTDFEITKVDSASLTLTSNGFVIGTRQYMAPEHLYRKPACPAFDVWSLAVTAFELLTGDPPFSPDYQDQWLKGVREYYPMPSRGNGAPAGTDPVFKRVFADTPEERYQTCTEFVRALAAAVQAPSQVKPNYSIGRLSKQAGDKYQAGDFAAAFKLYLAAAEEGDPKAMYNVGFLYEAGSGIARNSSKALDWYRKSADAGIPEAMNRAGLLLESGEASPAAIAEALRWYATAAARGSRAAAQNLARLNLNRGNSTQAKK